MASFIVIVMFLFMFSSGLKSLLYSTGYINYLNQTMDILPKQWDDLGIDRKAGANIIVGVIALVGLIYVCIYVIFAVFINSLLATVLAGILSVLTGKSMLDLHDFLTGKINKMRFGLTHYMDAILTMVFVTYFFDTYLNVRNSTFLPNIVLEVIFVVIGIFIGLVRAARTNRKYSSKEQ